MEFSRQEYWSGLPFPSPGIFPTQGSRPGPLHRRQVFYLQSRQGAVLLALCLSIQFNWRDCSDWDGVVQSGFHVFVSGV